MAYSWTSAKTQMFTMPHRFLRFGLRPLLTLIALCAGAPLLAAGSIGLTTAQCRNPDFAGVSGIDGSTQISALRANVRPDAFAEIFGDVLIYNKDVRLQADNAQLSFTDNRITLNNNVSIVDANLCITGTRASGNFLIGEGSVEQAQFLQPQSNLRGSAAEIKLSGRQRFELSEGVVTRCPRGTDFWQISSGSLVADQVQSALTVKNMVLRIKQVPVLYLPYLKIPVTTERQSGFLPIGLSQNSRSGVETDLKYYFNLRSDLDATLGLRHMSQRGQLFEAEVRGLGANQQGQFNGAFLPEDRVNDLRSLAPSQNQDASNRNMMSLFYDFKLAGLTTKINFSKASDLNFLRDFDSDLAPYSGHLGGLRPANPQYGSILPALNQRISLQYERTHLKADLSYQGFQMLVPQLNQQIEKRPELDIQYNRSLGRLRGTTRLRLTESRMQDPDPDTFQGQRQVFDAQLTWPYENALGYLKSTVGAKLRRYRATQEAEAGPVFNSPFLHVLAGTRLTHRGGTRSIDRILEPKISITLGRNHRDQPQFGIDSAWLEPNYPSMFNPYASVGADWGVSGHTLALGVDHRWLERSSGHQLGRISVGQSYQATTDQPARGGRRGHQTDFQAELTSAGAITGRIDLSYQHQQQAIASGFLSLSYRPGGSTLISLQHRYRTAEHLFGQAGIMPESSVSQIALQAPIGKGFQVRGLWGRNNRASKDIESLLGVSYNGCCWTVDAAYRKSFDPKLTWVAGQYQIDAQTRTGIFFSFELKGLMQIGSDMTRVFERSVPGFTAATR